VKSGRQGHVTHHRDLSRTFTDRAVRIELFTARVLHWYRK